MNAIEQLMREYGVEEPARREPATPAEMQARFNVFIELHEFRPGELVTWKPSFQHRVANGPFIVVDVLSAPEIDTDEDMGSAHFNEPLDLLVGNMIPGRGFVTFHLDSRRLMPYHGPAEELGNAYEHYRTHIDKKYDFNVGNIVEWKPGLQNKRSDGPFIVTQLLDEPVIQTTEADSPYFREPLDIVLGSVDMDHDVLVEHHCDSRRFQPYTGDK